MLIDQAHRLSAFVIAEAIETRSEREWVSASGVDALQGFEISSPLAEEDFFTWLRRYA
jgi:EAL domain-containing protein (putative c-di-GMP-specific phosphodiesterase class I)